METTKECGYLDPQKGPKVKFARFVGGELILFSTYTTELEYIAVSHVFRKTEWFSIPGIKNEVLASTQKAAFIEKELPALIGDRAFWMDILTVNQRIQAEVISVVGAIPWIFRNAVQTLAVREDDGIYSCCEKVLEGIQDWDSHCSALANHRINHIDDMCDESYLQRLWTFQECLLSHSIRFVVCHRGRCLLACTFKDFMLKCPENHSKKKKVERGRFYKQQADLERLHYSLWVLWYCFRSGAKIEVSLGEFANAYVYGKTIARSKPRPRTMAEDIHTGSFVVVNLVSRRAASEPRDYIYATMPAFPWYSYPANAENMAFGGLFVDLYNQAAENRHSFAPKITASMIQSSATDTSRAWLPSKQQPKPECLGDFLKLLGQRLRRDTPNNISCFHATTGVRVFPIDGDTSLEFLPMIQSAIKFSESIWRECHVGGELSEYGSYVSSSWEMDVTDAAYMGWLPHREKPIDSHLRAIEDEDQTIITEGPSVEFTTIPAEQESSFRSSTVDHHVYHAPILEYSRSILDSAWHALDPTSPDPNHKAVFERYLHEMRSRWSKQLLHTLTLLTAMVNCQIGLSAARWVRKYFVPALIQYDDNNKVLGLLAKHTFPSEKFEVKQMMSVGRHLQGPSLGKDLVLVDPAVPSAPVGIILDFNYGDHEEEDFEGRMQVLYRGLWRFGPPEELDFVYVSPETYAATMQERMQEHGE